MHLKKIQIAIMVRTTKILTSILICGLVYSFYRASTGEGGGGLQDLFEALMYSSIALFIVSLMILVVNINDLRNHWPAFIFLFTGFPLTLEFGLGVIAKAEYNRTPDLSVKYELPVTREQYLSDSTKIQLAINSLIDLRNSEYGGTDVLYGVIDTIIYSQTGDKIFVSYMSKFAPNDMGNDLDPDYLGAAKRDSVFWQLREVSDQMGGSFHDESTLKREVRKFYFNQFSFLDKDSTKENYFWKIVR
jgi:hypothetical protein